MVSSSGSRDWSLFKGIHDLGFGFYAYFQSAQSAEESAGVRGKIEQARIVVQRTLDCQAYIVALSTAGTRKGEDESGGGGGGTRTCV